jgi:predicted small lipoprotein YifL
MRRFLPVFLAGSALLFSSFCGKKGPLLLPLVKTPKSVEKQSLLQRGNKVVLEWTNPTTYLDGNALDGISEVEIWFLEQPLPTEGQAALTKEEFEDKAGLKASIKSEQFAQFRKTANTESPDFCYFQPLSPDDLGKKSLIFSIKVKDLHRRKSDLSGLLTLAPRSLPSPPLDLKSAVFEDRIELRWQPPQGTGDPSAPAQVAGYNVYRAEGEAEPLLLNAALLKSPEYADKEFVFGKPYRYFVRASANEAAPFLESDDSPAIDITPQDTFPPAVPAGLITIVGADFITISWEANPEKDLAGYKVWRKKKGQTEFRLLTAEIHLENTFTDRAVEKNQRYEYAVTALDTSGNESQKSGIVSEIIKEGER